MLETLLSPVLSSFFFFNDPATTEIYTLSLHDALPIRDAIAGKHAYSRYTWNLVGPDACATPSPSLTPRSEEHTSELQSRENLVCRLLLEKKKKPIQTVFDV